MTAPLPAPGHNGADDHAAISRTFIAHAREELQKGNNLQASEKVWGAAAHALKAVAIQRGWRHGRHEALFDIADQVGKELGRTDFSNVISIAHALHVNFYENLRREESIRSAIDAIEQFVTDLDEIRSMPPRPFTVVTNSDRDRLQSLLGRSVAIGAYSDVGFARPLRGSRPS